MGGTGGLTDGTYTFEKDKVVEESEQSLAEINLSHY